MDFVMQETTLQLTASLFGKTFFFQVLKFPGGITIIPQQNAFLLQKVDMLFNFSLNFPINKVEDKLSELKDQMKSGLLLSSYEVCTCCYVQTTIDFVLSFHCLCCIFCSEC